MTLAQRVAQLRTAKGMTQQELATAATLSVSVISQIEQGTNKDPRMNTLKALAHALGVTLDELAGDSAAEVKLKRMRGK